MATLISTIMRVAICLEKLNDFNENEGSFIIYQWNFEKYKKWNSECIELYHLSRKVILN